MFALSVLFLIVFLVGFPALTLLAVKSSEYEPTNVRSFRNISGGACLVLSLLCFARSCLCVIPLGNVGVQTVFGKMQSRMLKEGLNLKSPLAHVHRMTVQTQSYTMSIVQEEGEKSKPDSIKVLSKDNLEVEMDLTVLYSLVPGDAQLIYQNIGGTEQYVEKLVRPSIRTAIRNSASKFEASILMSSGRATAEADIQKSMEDSFRNFFSKKGIPVGVICEQVLLRNVQPPATLKAAIEDKLSKEQQKDAMEFVLDTEKKKAEQRIIEAKGLAESQLIIDKTLTPEYLQWKYIETLEKLVNSPNNTVVILPFDQKLTPLLNIQGGTLGQKKD